MNNDEEEKLGSYSNLSQFNHINVEMNTSNNNGKQPATAAANSIQWDVEEDHLLSYFLGANDGASHDSNIPAADIAVEQQHQQPAAQMMPTSILRSSASQPNSIHANNKMVGNLPNTSPSLESFVNVRARDSSGALTNNTGTSMSMGTLPTPHSVHFYDEQYPPQAAAAMPSHVNSQGSIHKVPSRASNASSNGSSSSSLAAMASAMALGNPNQIMMMQQKLQNRDQVVSGVQYQLNSSISPITPVNMMMGSPSGQEFMMLPPPTQSNNMITQMAQNIGGQQQQQQQHLMNLQQNMLIAQAPISMNNQVPNNASQQQQQQQQTNFLPQMNPPNQPLTSMQTQPYAKGGFPDPQSVTSSILAAQPPPQQQHYPELPQQPMSQPHLPQQQQQSQQIQIGVNGQTIPINAVPTANGGLVYQIDSSVVPTTGLRYFTKAINDVSKPEEKKNVDPQVMAEKRAQRLARNRQSARNSRRRKKEQLQNLEAKVQKLQRELESEVRSKVSSMEGGLVKQREDMMEQWLANNSSDSISPDEEQEGDDERRKQLALILQETGVNCQVRRAVVAHQYNMLRNTFLSPMNHYSVWMLLQSASFFTEAARQRDAAAAASNEVVDKVNDRANSKAIGETIYNEDVERVGRVISNSKDGLKTWPLYCHEITMTMEQEERIVDQLHVKAKNTPQLEEKLQNIKTATDATRHLQNAMQCHTQLAAKRNETLLLEILTPTQAALFKEWFKKNKDMCKALMEMELAASAADSSNVQSESTLGGVCKQLDDMRLTDSTY